MLVFKKTIAVIFVYSIFSILPVYSTESLYNSINLPESHLPYYFNNFPKVLDECLSNKSCIYHELLNSPDYDPKKCWGYEPECELENAFSVPKCAAEKPAWVKDHETYLNTFYEQADFGYIRNQINELMVLCAPLFPNDSMLECSKNLRFCHGRNIMINFTDLATFQEQWRYRTDILKPGQIGN